MRQITAVLLAAALCGCAVTSSNPLTELHESEPVPDSLIGTWEVEELMGRVPETPSSVIIGRSSDGSLRFQLLQGKNSVQQVAAVGEIGGVRILSLPSELEEWTFVSLVDLGDNRLSFLELDVEAITEDIELGLVEGEVSPFGVGDQIVRLTAGSEELRAYFAERSLFAGEFMILKKAPTT